MNANERESDRFRQTEQGLIGIQGIPRVKVSRRPAVRPKGGDGPGSLPLFPEMAPDPGRGAEAQPFLKWAGGKTQLLAQFEPLFPEKIASYCEPFVGGGAVFFHLKSRFPEMRARLHDNNPELINCYQVLRDRVEELMRGLDEHRERFRAAGKPYYYEVRNQHQLTDPIERAARMIFLNKTCYNGLWRVNSRGRFNVPVGSYRPETVTLYDPANLVAVSHALAGVSLAVSDFRQTLRAAVPGDFAYIDPPYVPLSATASFTSYTKEVFGEPEQRELADCFREAARRGVRLMLSNSDTRLVRRLYDGFTIHTVQARRAVNCQATKRGQVPEVVVLSGSPTS
jgi:DNA adenine methylase